jgi:hypothetical protein
MSIDVTTVMRLIQEIEREDAIDWGMLNIGEEDASRLLATSVIEHYETQIQPMHGTDRDYVIVAAIAKLTIENFVLSIKLAQATGRTS